MSAVATPTLVGSKSLGNVSVAELDFPADSIDVVRAKRVYDDLGFIVVRGLLRDQMPAMQRELDHAVDVAARELPDAENARYGWLTRSGAVFTERSVDLPSVPGRKQLIVLPLNQKNSPAMRSCSESPGLRRIVGTLLGGDIHPIGTGQCMYKEASGTAMGLHQDGVYTRVDGYQDVVTAFTYVVPTSIERGCIWLIPRSHHFELLPHHESGEHMGCLREDICDWQDAVPLPGEPGDTFFWHWKTIHGSKPNVTDMPRPAIVARFGLPAEAELMATKGLGQW